MCQCSLGVRGDRGTFGSSQFGGVCKPMGCFLRHSCGLQATHNVGLDQPMSIPDLMASLTMCRGFGFGNMPRNIARRKPDDVVDCKLLLTRFCSFVQHIRRTSRTITDMSQPKVKHIWICFGIHRPMCKCLSIQTTGV